MRLKTKISEMEICTRTEASTCKTEIVNTTHKRRAKTSAKRLIIKANCIRE